jgi:hypothetical protein
MGATGDVYKTITVTQLCAALALYDAGQLRLKSLRVFFASFELKAIREAAARSRKPVGRKGRGQLPIYRLRELARFTGLTEPALRRECEALQEHGLVSITESSIEHSRSAPEIALPMIETVRGNRSALRPIPVPRRILRYLSRCSQITMMKTIVAYLIRGLTIDRTTGEIRNTGSVKASWIADSFWISIRSVKSARKQLLELGWLSGDSTISQHKLNRTGSFFEINLEWNPIAETNPKVVDSIESPVDNSEDRTRQFAPPVVETTAKFAPPIRDLKTSIEDRNQKTRRADPSGVCTANSGKREPTLCDVILDDLKDFHRSRELFRQAVRRNVIADSEASFLNWIAAAVRARSCESRDPVKVFLGIVRRGLWSHITQEDEDRARTAIRRYGDQDAALPKEVKEILRMVA